MLDEREQVKSLSEEVHEAVGEILWDLNQLEVFEPASVPANLRRSVATLAKLVERLADRIDADASTDFMAGIEPDAVRA